METELSTFRRQQGLRSGHPLQQNPGKSVAARQKNLRLLASEGADGLGDVRELGNGSHLQIVGQANSGDELSRQKARRGEEAIKQFLDGAPDQVLSEVRYLSVFIDEKYSAGLLDRGFDQLPVIRPKAAQVDQLGINAVLSKGGCRLEAQRLCPTVAHHRDATSFAHHFALPDRDRIRLKVGPRRLPLRAIAQGGIDHL